MSKLPLVALVPLVGSLAAFAFTASADDMPTRKAGLWELKMSFDGNQVPPQAMQQCIDPATDKEMSQPPGMEGVDVEKACKRNISRSGDTMTIDSTCTFSGRTTQSHTTVTGSFDSAYSMKVAVQSDPPSPRGVMNVSMDAKYLGACKPDQKPGDIVMPGGVKINLADMKKLRAGVAQPPGR
jgi:hypothetical protein